MFQGASTSKGAVPPPRRPLVAIVADLRQILGRLAKTSYALANLEGEMVDYEGALGDLGDADGNGSVTTDSEHFREVVRMVRAVGDARRRAKETLIADIQGSAGVMDQLQHVAVQHGLNVERFSGRFRSFVGRRFGEE
ncbi:hypothetical protein HDV00_009540 [Rhizophlyctis rosea]|nr:hypothetical protein HDV00_009540 [Rhizophlyctis rosea]